MCVSRAGVGFRGGTLRRFHGAGGALHQVQPGETDGAHQDFLVAMQRHQGGQAIPFTFSCSFFFFFLIAYDVFWYMYICLFLFSAK